MRRSEDSEAPRQAHEWLSFEDIGEDRTWLFDVTFLASSWRCIFGAGCQGVLTGLAEQRFEGCCSYGAHFTGDEDVRRVEQVVRRLAPRQWQHHARSRGRSPLTTRSGTTTTRIVDGACIFLNRPGFAGGPGCALHRLALEEGTSPISTKPDVCWQLPLRREDSTDEATGHVTSTVTQWDRRHWGSAGEEFAWWCTEAPEAFTADEAVYVSLREELVALVGAGPYATVASYLGQRLGERRLLDHPVVLRSTR